MKYIFIVFFSCLIAACGRQKTAEIGERPESGPFESKYASVVEFWDDEVPEKYELTGERLFPLDIWPVTSFVVLGDYVVYYSGMSPTSLNVRTMEGEHIAAFQHKGRGPYEMLSGRDIHYSPRRNSFSFCDYQQQKILEYDVAPFMEVMAGRKRAPQAIDTSDLLFITPSRIFI